MALLQYFKLKKQKEHLPDPNGPLHESEDSVFWDFFGKCVKRAVHGRNVHCIT